jgi:hypothetical protein
MDAHCVRLAHPMVSARRLNNDAAARDAAVPSLDLDDIGRDEAANMRRRFQPVNLKLKRCFHRANPQNDQIFLGPLLGRSLIDSNDAAVNGLNNFFLGKGHILSDDGLQLLDHTVRLTHDWVNELDGDLAGTTATGLSVCCVLYFMRCGTA